MLARIAFVFALLSSSLAHGAFNDVTSAAWYAPFVERAQEMGIVGGYTDEAGQPTGMFGPTNKVTVAEAVKMAVEASHIGNIGSAVDTVDVSGHWAEPYIAILRQRTNISFVTGKEIDRPITRGELAELISTALVGSFMLGDIPPCFSPTQPLFSDVRFDDVHAGNISTVLRLNLMVGDNRSSYDEEAAALACPPLTTFRPNDSLNRAEAAKVMVLARDHVSRFCADNPSGEGYFGYQNGPRCNDL